MQLTLNCTPRPEGINPRALRRSGQIPGTVYGHQGSGSTAISLNVKDVELLLRKANPNNTLIELNINDGDFKGITLLREVQKHPYKNSVYHLSFFAIATQAKVAVNIPLKFVGTPIGVKSGGIVEILMNRLQVSCPPANVPDHIDVEVAHLAEGKGIYAGDIVLPEGVTRTTDTAPLVYTVAIGRKSSKS
jgi:large subunit ribosomal protein L25